ncbi:hypothetical protein PRIPAC_82698 [Pristionchus pacificus]|uniref:Uncharacterized protein n=1 Tax=Pristionchus pacificus TaxID=54126 RepID=A0A2A6BHH9_PRIPA|nr:hypothetical protein PRIPAC_82698 [Pristionchus pacificus]|eukprot:PDM65286.1 hypothetical protein PRIPAC_52228 [Pristionchus pacificus]
MCGQMGHLTRMCKQQTAFIIRSSFGAHEANPNGKDHTEEKVIGKDHTVEEVITEVECETEGFRDHKAPAVIENDIVKVRVPEAKDKLVKVRVPEAKDELVKAYVPEANVILVKAITPEAKHKKGVKVECEVGHSQDHNEPEALQINLVKVECEAGSARDHNAPEAKVKVRGHETNDAGYTEIFLQDRYSDIVRVAPENTVVGKSSRVEKKAKFKPISERDNPIQCDHLSSEIDVKMIHEFFISSQFPSCTSYPPQESFWIVWDMFFNVPSK